MSIAATSLDFALERISWHARQREKWMRQARELAAKHGGRNFVPSCVQTAVDGARHANRQILYYRNYARRVVR